MRILLYSDTPDVNGAGQINHMIVCGLARRGLEVHVAQAHADHALIRGQIEIGVHHHWLQPDNIYNNPLSARAFTDFDEPQRIFTACSPELVLFADGAPASNLAAKQVASTRGIPFLCLVHKVDDRTLDEFIVHQPTVTEVYRAARQVVAVSHQNLSLLHKRAGLPLEKGLVILNARPDEFFARRNATVRRALRNQLEIAPDALVCLTSARVELGKGCHYLLETARALRASEHWSRLHFLWAGDGTRLQQMRALARLLQVDEHVHFLGQCSDVVELLDAADIFILPSQVEGMPLAVLEAMARSLPVMATDVGGTAEALGECGVLLPDPTVDKPAMLRAIAATLAHWAGAAETREAVGLAANERAARLFRESRMVDDYLALVRGVMGE